MKHEGIENVSNLAGSRNRGVEFNLNPPKRGDEFNLNRLFSVRFTTTWKQKTARDDDGRTLLLRHHNISAATNHAQASQKPTFIQKVSKHIIAFACLPSAEPRDEQWPSPQPQPDQIMAFALLAVWYHCHGRLLQLLP